MAKFHSGSGASACARNIRERTATAEQIQEALQQIQVLTTRMAALGTQLQFESARAQQAEQERSTLIQSLGTMRTNRGDAMVDTKGIGQPFTLKGGADDDFGEWTHKVRTFMLASFGDEDSHCSNKGSTTAKDCCQDLRSFAEETA